MQARQAHCGPYEFGSHISLAQPDNKKYINTRQRLLLHPYENDADIGMRYQQPVRRLLSAVSQEKEKCEHPAFWIVAINVEYRGVNHLANIRTVQRRARARRGSCVADASQII